jgi:hypothetical protein
VSDNLHTPTNVHAYDLSTIGVIIAGVDTSGTLPAAVYEYGVAGVNQVGETLISTASVTLPGGVATYLTWDAQPGAFGYSIYRKNNATSAWEFLETIGAADTYYVDKGLVTPDRDC